MKCSCPIWADGYLNGEREFRKSLKTRDMARARKRIAALEEPKESRIAKPINEAVDQFLAHCKAHGTQDSTIRKYTGGMAALLTYCEKYEIDFVNQLDVVAVDNYRAYRNVAPVTMKNELRLLRYFFRFSQARDWHEGNPAKQIPFPTIKPTEKQPYTREEFETILAASSRIGHVEYERLRAKAMLLTLRYTALRIGDVAMLARDRVTLDGRRWRIFVRTGKKGNPVFLPVPQEMKDALDAVPRKSESYFFWLGKNSPRTMVGIANRVLRSVFRKSGVKHAHSHRFRHTLATELLGCGATCDEVADVLGNSAEMVRKYYGQWSPVRQARIDDLMEKVHSAAVYAPMAGKSNGHILDTYPKH